MSESIITLGIGATPDLDWFITSGLHCTGVEAAIFGLGRNAAYVPRRARAVAIPRKKRAVAIPRKQRAGVSQ